MVLSCHNAIVIGAYLKRFISKPLIKLIIIHSGTALHQLYLCITCLTLNRIAVTVRLRNIIMLVLDTFDVTNITV